MQKINSHKILFMLGLIMLWANIGGQAQSTNAQEHKGQGYIFAASVVGEDRGAGFQLGGGGEGFIYKGLGAGAEISVFTTERSFREGIGAFSPNVSYHFLNASRDGKWVPFVTGGYTLYFRSDVANGVNFGGGVNYWFKERLGLRLEVRDQVISLDGTGHYAAFRAGISFR